MEAVCNRAGKQVGPSSAFHFLREGVMATSGLVLVPKETKGDSELSLEGVLIAGAMGDMGQSWENRGWFKAGEM